MQEQDGKGKFDISARLEELRQEHAALAWEGSFRDYFELVTQNPRLAQLSHARINDMIHAARRGEAQRGHARRDRPLQVLRLGAVRHRGAHRAHRRVLQVGGAAARSPQAHPAPDGPGRRRQVDHRHDAQARPGGVDARRGRRGLRHQGLPDARGAAAPHPRTSCAPRSRSITASTSKATSARSAATRWSTPTADATRTCASTASSSPRRTASASAPSRPPTRSRRTSPS